MSDWIKRIIIEIDDAMTPNDAKDIADHILDGIGRCWSETTTGPVYHEGQHLANVTVRKLPISLQMALDGGASLLTIDKIAEEMVQAAITDAIKDGVIGGLQPIGDILHAANALHRTVIGEAGDENDKLVLAGLEASSPAELRENVKSYRERIRFLERELHLY